MTENGKAQIQTLGAGLLAFVGVVGAGALLILPHGGAAVKAPNTVYAPVDAASALAAPASPVKIDRAAAPAPAGSMTSSPLPLLPASEREDAPGAAAEAAAGSSTPSSNVRRLVASQGLDGSSSASSTAQASVASASAAKIAAKSVKKTFVAPKLDLSKTSAIASTVHYGVSSRSELMGRAAGPVYNFAGAKADGQSAQVAAGSMQGIDAAQQQIDSSNLTDAQKATIDSSLGQVRQTVTAPASGAQQ